MNKIAALATLTFISTTALALGAQSKALAGGLNIPGYGSQAQPRAGAFVAKADDPSAIFHNPAGLAKLKGTIVQLGINLINFSQTFARSGTYDECSDAKCPVAALPYEGQRYAKIENQSHGKFGVGDFAVVPLLSASSDFGLDIPLVFGAGIFAPGASSADREYAPNYEIEADPNSPPPPGRYDTIRQEVLFLMPSVAAGYSVSDQLDLGVRLSWGFGKIKGQSALWGLRNFEEWEAKDVQFGVDQTDNFVPSFGFGAMYHPREDLSLGFNYRSSSSLETDGIGTVVSGSATLIDGIDVLQPRTDGPYVCGAGGTLVAFRNCVALKLPQVASVGARWILRNERGEERADVEFDVQWENWSAASTTVNRIDAKTVTLPVLPPTNIRHGFKDVFSLRLGGSYTLPVAGDALSVRGGLAYDTETAPVSWTRLDQDGFARTTLASGFAYEIEGWRFELSGGVVLEGTRVVDHGDCNPDLGGNLGCSGNDVETPVANRDAPDPSQPIYGEGNQSQSPFNAGVYKQGYVFAGAGLTAWF